MLQGDDIKNWLTSSRYGATLDKSEVENVDFSRAILARTSKAKMSGWACVAPAEEVKNNYNGARCDGCPSAVFAGYSRYYRPSKAGLRTLLEAIKRF
jgi:hypothetical protein